MSAKANELEDPLLTMKEPQRNCPRHGFHVAWLTFDFERDCGARHYCLKCVEELMRSLAIGVVDE